MPQNADAESGPWNSMKVLPDTYGSLMSSISGGGPNTPPGFYKDNQGTMRWWDGAAFTEQTQDSATNFGGGSPVPPHATAKTPWYKKKWVWAVAAVLIIIAIAGGGGEGDQTPVADDTKTSKPEPKPSKSAQPEWKRVNKLSGNTNKAGPDFHLNGCDTRMTYNVQGDPASTLVAFYVMDSGAQLMEDGGIPVASPTKSGPGETVIRKDEGDYYLDVVAANAEWQVQVQEKC